jgi:hypothetical protein
VAGADARRERAGDPLMQKVEESLCVMLSKLSEECRLFV